MHVCRAALLHSRVPRSLSRQPGGASLPGSLAGGARAPLPGFREPRSPKDSGVQGALAHLPRSGLSLHGLDSFARMRVTRRREEKRWVRGQVAAHQPQEQRHAGLGPAGNRREPPAPRPAGLLPLAPPLPSRPRPERRPHQHHQGLAVYRWEPPAPSPATELQGGRHLAGANLCYPEGLLQPNFRQVKIRGGARGEGRGGEGTFGLWRDAARTTGG